MEVQVVCFVVNQYCFLGVEVKGYKCCYYLYGLVLIYVIGYVLKINDKDVECFDRENKLVNYVVIYDIGKLGIECYYEDILYG